MQHTLIFVPALLGFACLALAMQRHQHDVLGQPLTPRTTRNLRLLGWLALLASLSWAVRHMGWGLGLVCYSGHTSVAAATVLLALALTQRYRTHKIINQNKII